MKKVEIRTVVPAKLSICRFGLFFFLFMCGNILGGQAQEKRMEPGKDKLKVGYDHIKYGAGYWILDKKTLNVLETVRTGDSKTKLPSQKVTPEAFAKVKRTMNDSGKSPPFIR